MYVFDFEANLTKPDFYAQVAESLKHLIEGQRNWITNYANASALLFHAMTRIDYFKQKPINWVGFYVRDPTDANWLILGPFQGKVACTRIKLGRGVCGTAAQSQQTQVVANVHEFPGHIACDSTSNSEIVIPIFQNSSNSTAENNAQNSTATAPKELIGVLDIDSTALATFDQIDKEGLENFCAILSQGSDFV